VQCPHAAVLHNAMHNKWGTPRPREFYGLGPDWIMYLLNHKNEKGMSKIAFVLWRAWSVLNSVTEAGEGISIEGSVNFLTQYYQRFDTGENKRLWIWGKG
jgi:hypothetical protein